MEKQYQDDDDEIEIDIKELFYELKKKLWMIIAALIIGAGSAGAYSALVMVPQFRSEAKLYVLSKETTLTSLADLQIGSQLTQDYKVLVTSRPVLQGVVDHLGLNLTYKELAGKLTINNPSGTRILSLSVEDADPYMAKAIVDDIAFTASDYIGEIMEMIPPKLIEDGEVATVKVSPSTKKNAAIGGLVAMLFVCGLIILRFVMNDSIRTEEDIHKYLDLPVLSVIPKKKDKKEDSKKVQSKRKTSKGSKANTGRKTNE